jgi:hypothetical protein
MTPHALRRVESIDMSSKPSGALVAAVAILAMLCMVGAVYAGGTGHIPAAMTGATLFVALGGCAFELARRRSV